MCSISVATVSTTIGGTPCETYSRLIHNMQSRANVNRTVTSSHGYLKRENPNSGITSDNFEKNIYDGLQLNVALYLQVGYRTRWQTYLW